MSAVSLRPHHGLCLPNFRGNGYSDGFCANMTRMKEKLYKNPRISVRITEGADDLCEHCPNRRGSVCMSGRPAVFDRHVLEQTGISYGDVLTWEKFNSLTHPLIPARLDTICDGCQWLDLCRTISAGSAQKSGLTSAAHASQSRNIPTATPHPQ